MRHFAGPLAHVGRLPRLRVAHLTDLHIGRMTPIRVQLAAVDLINRQRPDLVVISGDFVCHSQLYLDELVAVMGCIEAPVIGVLGNHDYWCGAGEVRAALLKAGVELLTNRHTLLTLRGAKLQVVGLDDAYTGHARLDEAVKGLRRDIPALGLSHIGEEADALWHHGIPLVLSGHTHGGQVTLARLNELSVGKLAGHRYVHGLYGTRRPSLAGDGPQGAVYVGAGIGAAVLPLRLGDRGQREVTLFELGREPGTLEEHHCEQEPLEGRRPSCELVSKRRADVERRRQRREKRARRR